MSKLFWEAIPGLQVNDEQRALFDRVEIEKVVSTRDRSAIKIYIRSERLIHKRSISQMEAEIKKQLFPGVGTSVSIVEKYCLSAQYTPENLMRAYEDSILYELKPYSLVLHNLMKKSRWEFTDAHVCLMHLDDMLVARSKAGELKRILEKIFMERCGIDLDVRFQYEAVKNKTDNSAEERRQAEEILRRAGKAAGEDGMLYWTSLPTRMCRPAERPRQERMHLPRRRQQAARERLRPVSLLNPQMQTVRVPVRVANSEERTVSATENPPSRRNRKMTMCCLDMISTIIPRPSVTLPLRWVRW